MAYDKALQRRRVDDDEEDAPVRPCSQRRAEPQRPWALIALGGIAVAAAGLLLWKTTDQRERADPQAARAAADARAAQVSDARAAQEMRARIDALERQWRFGEGAKALPEVRALANQGELRAMTLLGCMLLGGSPYRNAIGSPPDPAEARQWLERAASQGDPVAAVRLGGLYERGEQTARQPSLAENWYLRAARQGHAAGLYSLGMLYARGAAPVSQRPIPAWMQLTLADRPSSARAGLIRLKERMPPSDIAEAERLADAWKPGLPLGR